MASDEELRSSIERAKQAFRTKADGRPPLGWREDDRGASEQAPSPPAGHGQAGNGATPAALHPFFRGLLDTLPEPGANWPQPEREQWLETARHIFALLYSDIDERQPLPFPQRTPPPPPQSERWSA
jgi:hypothetical protein